ncbi:hypothetical protein KFE25_012766 [Diacronema lutheri]|uniref:Pyruvate carboxylase n=2 Tax=Diacronema lutheri TaxID=2081491 RepID=A0A8J6C497_DIALT|nr:hypothetical protein KFE25_012766 [Diacronema lutheri]
MPSTGRIKKLMAANRGEIAIRIFRAAAELNLRTVAIFSKEDISSVHRYKADEAYQVGKGKSPIGAYLSYEEIVEMALKHRVDAIHPGYGFLSENAAFAKLCEDNGIAFVGPTAASLEQFGDKTKARNLAISHNVPVVPGTAHALEDPAAARAWCAEHGYPVILKAAHGGGGKGMRVVRSEAEIEQSFALCSGEALKSFGNGEVFIERYVDRPRHIEIQILGDGTDVVHLYDRDCSVQRRHQKVVEVAPASGLPPALRQRLFDDAVRITKASGYRAAGTVEFLVEPTTGSYFFIEVNPRVQVEHTVTEVITGIDIVQSQILLAGGAKLQKDLGLTQDAISTRGYAIQCRVTTEDPANNFQPDTGRLQVWRPAEGFGIRLDGGNSYAGSVISPYYDSMLMKVTGSALTFEGTAAKVSRALRESRIRGVKTNIPFMLNVLKHPVFLSAKCTTSFIEDSQKELFDFPRDASQDRATKMLDYLAELAVNGRSVVGAEGPRTPDFAVVLPPPELTDKRAPPPGFKQVLERGGPEAFAKAVRAHKGLLLTDTTWRDAHQSLLATRVRTRDIMAIAPATAQLLHPLYSIENWGGATFDVALRFLHECPWDRLAEMREAVPNVPFQMLLRGANGVGYTSYPDNVVFKFCDTAVKSGMDVFRIFDSLNYLDNMKLGIDAVGAAGGVIEAAVAYTGDITDESKTKYTLDYYLEFVRQLVEHKIHVLAIKDMAGLLKPAAAVALVGAIRREFPDLPIHVHTHDTAGTGVASMLAAAHAGADVVDCAIDPMSGTTSQPSMGAIIGTTLNTPLETGLSIGSIVPLMDYWESIRVSYAAFEANQKSGSADVYLHEMPGGQYTNLLFQSKQLGLAGQWPQVKKAYAEANVLLGDIVKVTPSSKVVGDLAQFMVANKLSAEDVRRDAAKLNMPSSVVEYFEGLLGVPPGGFPPLQAAVLKGRKAISGRPGATMAPCDFEATRAKVAAAIGTTAESVPDTDLMSYLMYPKVFTDYRKQIARFGSLTKLPTRAFVEPMEKGEQIEVEIEEGKLLSIKLLAIGELVPKSGTREVFFELNGVPRSVVVTDRTAESSTTMRPKANKEEAGQVGAPMGGMVVAIKVKEGDVLAEGASLMTLSAMKMETAISAPIAGKVEQVTVAINEDVAQGDLLVKIVPSSN